MYFHLFFTDKIDLTLARDGTNPSQISTWFGHTADRAIDGKFEVPGYNSIRYCTHTNNEAKAWWKIKFDKLYAVQSVTLFNRKFGKYKNVIKITPRMQY